MGLDFFRRSVELVEKYRRPGMTVEHTIQTNGTLLDAEWADFFREHGFLVGLSLDGPAEIHDANRVDKGGKGTHAQGAGRARLLAEHGADFNILCTVHSQNGTRGREVYRYFRDEVGARFVQFIPIIERATPELIEVAESGWGSHVEGRPLYTQSGSLVTERSISAEHVGSLPHRRLRGVGAPRHRRGLRADVRRHPRQLRGRAALVVRLQRDVRHGHGHGT